MTRQEDALNACRVYIQSQAEARDREKGRLHPFVTISRQVGAGGVTVGRLLTEYLQRHDKGNGAAAKWTLFDKDLLQEVAQDHGLSKQAVDLLPDEDRAWFEDVIDRVLGLGKTQSSLVKKTSQSILALAKLGRVILVGRGANLITRGMPGGVHVRLVGSPKKRVEHLVSYYGISHAQAEERVHQEDEGKRNYIRRYFHEDIDNPLLYDFTINTDHVSYDEAAKIISHAVTSVLHKSTSLFLAAP